MNIKYTTPKHIILITMKTKEKRKNLKAIMIEGTLLSKEQKNITDLLLKNRSQRTLKLHL